jgi:hypothetical protein
MEGGQDNLLAAAPAGLVLSLLYTSLLLNALFFAYLFRSPTQRGAASDNGVIAPVG